MTQSPNRMWNDNAFKLGLFSANCSGGLAVTKVPERWDASWDNNVELAQIADRAGLEFLLPIARWIGYGGETDFHGVTHETMTWAAGLLAKTENITVFATTHASFFHPIVAAKQTTTMDQISKGRFGLNIVAGWNKPEYDMFQIELPDEHDVRYGYAQEWWDILKKLWLEEGPFDWDGDYFKLRHAQNSPPLYAGKPPVMNAGSSPQGRAFAARNTDFLFTIIQDPDKAAEDVRDIKTIAQKEYKRDIDVFTSCHVVCRPTQKEAEDYYRYYSEENADWEAVDFLMKLQGLHAKSFSEEMLANFRPRFAAGHGTYPLVGDPDTIANEIETLYRAGLSGTTLTFVDYVAELPYFAEEVIPRLERKGLRQPAQRLAAE